MNVLSEKSFGERNSEETPVFGKTLLESDFVLVKCTKQISTTRTLLDCNP